MGSTTCSFSVNGTFTTPPIYVVRSAKSLYLSFDACKGLGLIPPCFPYQTRSIAAAVTTHQEQGSLGSNSAPCSPNAIPFAPLKENVERLDEWLLRHFSLSTFNAKKSPLLVMAEAPHCIHLTHDARRYACPVPASVPKDWEAEFKAQLDEDLRRGVVERVPIWEATKWCARMVIKGKKNGRPRRTADFQHVNAA